MMKYAIFNDFLSVRIATAVRKTRPKNKRTLVVRDCMLDLCSRRQDFESSYLTPQWYKESERGQPLCLLNVVQARTTSNRTETEC